LNRLNSRTQPLIGTKQSRHVKTVVYNMEKLKQSERNKNLALEDQSSRYQMMEELLGALASCTSSNGS